MRTPVELRNDAWDCLQRAEQAAGRRDKAILLILAQGWASLADEMERLGAAAKGEGVASLECTGTEREQTAAN
jgi:hypothetical protein